MSSDVLLIRALGVEGNSIPQGLLYIQSFLRKHGYTVSIWDRHINKNISKLKSALKDVSLVGISAMTSQLADAIYLAKIIRKWYSKIKIIFGGVHFTALPDTAKDIADNVIVGEGEQAVKDYLDSDCNLDFKVERSPIEDLDSIPKIAISNLKPIIRTKNNFHILTGRGCPYRCNFCLGEDQRPDGIRYHSIDYIVDYLKDIIRNLGIRSFFIVDDVFVLSPRRVYEFCDAVESKIKEKVRFECFTHAGHGDLKLYKRMKQVGFDKISMGVEHGNDRLLKFCGKNTTKKIIEKTCSNISRAGINIDLTYILGNATETNETISETIDFSIYLHNKFNAKSWFSYMQPLPGSLLYNVASQYGKWLINNDFQFASNIKPVYLPFDVAFDHLVTERKRGMRSSNG